MVAAVTGLIAEGPDDYRRVVAVALHHPRDALGHCRQPDGIVAQTVHRHHAVGFYIRFVNHVQAVAVAQAIPQRVVRVVGAAHGVKVMLLHQHNVPAHGVDVHHLAMFGMMLVAVDAANQQRLAVKLQQAVRNLYLTETQIAGLGFNHRAMFVF